MAHDITDTLRTQEQLYRQMGNERQGDVLRAARKEIELLREAAKPIVMWYANVRHEFSESYQRDFDKLAALVGEG
jgi:hypothetical protein